jgi:hypothetical protein
MGSMGAILVASFAWASLATLAGQQAFAELKPDRVHLAQGRKVGNYIADGLFNGGDQAMNDVVVKDIRRAVNPGFERVVIDLQATRAALGGEDAAIARPPYYQVSVNPDENRIVVTIWGKPRLEFNSRKVVSEMKKSSMIQSLDLLPPMDGDSWTFVANLKTKRPVEVFELTNPVRIIMDIKR